MSETALRILQPILDEGVATGAFPLAFAEVRQQGRVVFAGGAGGAKSSTLFDLASLTKVMSTTALVLSLWGDERTRLSPQTPVAHLLPEAALAKTGATVADLLFHRAGLPAFVPFFAPVMAHHPKLFDADCPPSLRAQVRAEVVEAALAQAPVQPLGAQAVYSDVGFIVLGELLSRATGHVEPLDQLFERRIARPLGLSARYRRLSALASPVSAGTVQLAPALAELTSAPDLAPTGTLRPREPAPGQEGMWKVTQHPSRVGEVDDDNAWAMDGVAGHAGLFGTAGDVAAFGQAVLEGFVSPSGNVLAPQMLWREALRRDALTPGSSRALGFDTPAESQGRGPSAGTKLGAIPPGAVGHLGFTGTSLWIDLHRQLVVALCTNRTAGPQGRSHQAIREFRPRFHDAVVDALASKE